nr:MAG TPA: hypothetical protein [Caudoviricetes sp.]
MHTNCTQTAHPIPQIQKFEVPSYAFSKNRAGSNPLKFRTCQR